MRFSLRVFYGAAEISAAFFYFVYLGLSAESSHYPLLSMILREWQY